jgi:hypothetical protein
MQPGNQQQVSPELKRLQQPAQNSIRAALRIAGPTSLLIGIVCLVVAVVNFFVSTGHNNPPGLFWLFFIGMPLVFIGGVLCQFAFMGAVARFIAGETAPVAADTANYVAEETKGAVETVAKAAAKGVAEGIEEARTKSDDRKS